MVASKGAVLTLVFPEQLGVEDFLGLGLIPAEVPVVVDPDRNLYKAAGATKASMLSLLNPATILKFAKTKNQGNTKGDGLQLGGVVVTNAKGAIKFLPQKSVADYPEDDDILALLDDIKAKDEI